MSPQVLVIALVVALKFIVPLLYVPFPFAAGWGNFLLDSIDGDILMPAGLPFETYQTVDKVADYWAYVCMLAWGWRSLIRREIVATFALRTVGQALFFATRNEQVFFYFPNLLEPLFLVYASMLQLAGAERAHALYRRHLKMVWAAILVYKFQDEYITHVANIDRTDTFRGIFDALRHWASRR